METVVWVVERNFSNDRRNDDWRYWSFPSRYLDEAWSKDWNDAIKMHDRNCAENAAEDMPDDWNIRICDHQIVDTTKPTYNELKAEVERLTKERDQAIEAGAMRIGPDGEILMTPVTVLESEDCPDLFAHLKALGEV